MANFLSDMLLGKLPTHIIKGSSRVVSFGSGESDIRLTTGSMRERILGYLYINGTPSVARDIAAGIQSNQARVTKVLKELIALGEVVGVKHECCVMEYALTAQGTLNLKRSPVFIV